MIKVTATELSQGIRTIYANKGIDTETIYLALLFLLADVSVNAAIKTTDVVKDITTARNLYIKQFYKEMS